VTHVDAKKGELMLSDGTKIAKDIIVVADGVHVSKIVPAQTSSERVILTNIF
jgi:hypothetical protein